MPADWDGSRDEIAAENLLNKEKVHKKHFLGIMLIWQTYFIWFFRTFVLQNLIIELVNMLTDPGDRGMVLSHSKFGPRLALYGPPMSGFHYYDSLPP